MRYSNRMIVPFLVTVCALTTIAFTSGHETALKGVFRSQSAPQVKPPKELEAVALKLVSQQHNIALSDLELESSSIVTYRFSGRKVNEFNIGDKRNDNAYQILLDNSANVINEMKLVQEEQAAKAAKYGKLEEDLFQDLQKAAADEEIGVLIWLDLGTDNDRPKDEPSMDSQKFKTMTPQEQQLLVQRLDDFDQRLKAYNNARAQRATDPIVQRFKELGYQPQVIGQGGYLYLKLKPPMIKTVEGWPEVRQISRGDRVAQPSGATSGADRRADTVEPGTELDRSRPCRLESSGREADRALDYRRGARLPTLTAESALWSILYN